MSKVTDKIIELLGDEAEELLNYECNTIPKENLHLPGPDFIDRVLVGSDRPVAVLRNMKALFSNGRLSGT
ncbi:MAG: fructose-bisphosphate aldolase, partial [Candidatus Cloacimonadota bacterium]